MPCAAIAGRAVIELTGSGFGIGHKFFQILHRQIGVHHVQAGHFRNQRDGREVFDRVVGQFGKNIGIHCQGADVSQNEGVLVGGAGNFLHRNIASPAGFVLDEHILADGFAHFTR